MGDFPRFVLSRVFTDPTDQNIVNRRYIQHLCGLLEYTDLDDDQKSDVLRLLILVGKKLVAVWLHYAAYKELENSLIDKARGNPISETDATVAIDYSQDLFLEFDELLVQVKSCLDHLVKIPAPIIGKHIWTLRTYGDRSRAVLQALDRNIPRQYAGRVDLLKHIVKQDAHWIGPCIDARDRINHFIDGGIDFKHFAVFATQDDAGVHLRVPMWSDQQTICDFLGVIWTNLIDFAESFTVASISLRFLPSLILVHVPVAAGSPTSPWSISTKEASDRAIKEFGGRKITP